MVTLIYILLFGIFGLGLSLIIYALYVITEYKKHSNQELLDYAIKVKHPISEKLKKIEKANYNGTPKVGKIDDMIDPEDLVSFMGFNFIQYVKMIPSVLIGLGILGTFIGLTLGVGSLDVSSAAAIQKGIEKLLINVGTAFWTSVWGMSFSLIFSIFSAFLFQEISKMYQIFVDSIEDASWIGVWDIISETTISEGEITSKIFDISNQVCMKIDGMAEQISSKIANYIGDRLESYQEDLLEAFQGGAGQAATQGAQRAKDTFDVLLTSLIGATDQINTAMNKLTNGLDKNIENLEILVVKIENTVSVFDDQINSMGGTLGQMSLIDESFQTINESFNQSTRTLDTATDTLTSALSQNSQLSSDFLESWQVTNREIKTVTGNFSEIEKSLSSTGNAIGKLFQETTKEISSFHESISVTSVSQMKEFRDAINNFSGRLSSAANELQDTMEAHPFIKSAQALGLVTEELGSSIKEGIQNLTIQISEMLQEKERFSNTLEPF